MSKGGWIKVRKKMAKYPETPQQGKVRIGGKLIRAVCKGLKGGEFFECRSTVLGCAFDDDKCGSELLELKKKLKEEDVD